MAEQLITIKVPSPQRRRGGVNRGLMMISADRNWIFVHIQKTGGNAIRAALGVEIDHAHKHFLARELRQLYSPEIWQQCIKFAFVRNPWERLVSWWSMIDGNRLRFTAASPPNKFAAYVLERASTFEEFITRCTDEIIEHDGRKCIFRNQIDYLVGEDGAVITDFIGRFERLQDDFSEVTKRLGLGYLELPRLNVSQHGSYAEYYTPAMADAVGRRYARDIEIFGYRFGE